MGVFIDLTGQVFDRWTVISEAESRGACGVVRWLCRCECGKEKLVNGATLRNGTSRSCGCLGREALRERSKRRRRSKHSRWIDLSGKTFGRLKALRPAVMPSGETKWLCRCECGKETYVYSSHLRFKRTESCGCLWYEKVSLAKTTHGHTSRRKGYHPLYRTWQNMKVRCTNPNSRAWKYYGGRGITVCSQWTESFEVFIRDMGDRPEGMTLDRIDVNGPYHPWNTRWATKSQQSKNRRPRRRKAAAKSDGGAGAEQTAEQANREES